MADRFYNYLWHVVHDWWYDYLGGLHMRIYWWRAEQKDKGNDQSIITPPVKRFSLRRGRHWDRRRR